MTTHLISILGKPKRSATGDRTYETVTYRFPDGTESTTTSFGLALGAWFAQRSKAPERMNRVLWLGTAQSGWAGLLQSVLGDAAVEEPLFEELFDAVEATQDQLDRVAARLSLATGQRHECRIVPPCADPAEQMDFVGVLTGELKPKDRVVLDLTHGLRNQSLMLAQSALMLEGAYGVKIIGLYYGGLEVPRKPGEPAPAVELTGLLHQARLAQALAAFRQTGDVRVLVEHLPEGGLRTQVANLGHAVAIHDYTQARNLATSVLKALQGEDLGAMTPLLQEALAAFKARSLAESQFQQAEAHLERKDYFRATLALFEGAITRVCQRKGWDHADPEARLGQASMALRALQSDDWKALEFLRNQMAHGIATDWYGLMQTAQNPDRLHALLNQLLQVIPKLADRA